MEKWRRKKKGEKKDERGRKPKGGEERAINGERGSWVGCSRVTV